jgi:hypothetical protein
MTERVCLPSRTDPAGPLEAFERLSLEQSGTILPVP